MFKKVAHLFKRKKEPVQKQEDGRNVRELLRENLSTVSVDVFYLDDPLVELPQKERQLYLKHFYDLSRDEKFMERIKYLVNKQALLTIQNIRNKDGSWDTAAGAMNINGIALVKDDVERLAAMHIKETVPEEDFNEYEI